MKFLNSKLEAQSAEDIAFAERLSAIANRGRGIVKPEPVVEFEPGIPPTEQHSWASLDLPDRGEQSAAA